MLAVHVSCQKIAHDQPVKDTKKVHNACSRNKTDNISSYDTPLQNIEIKQPQKDRKDVDTSRNEKILKELKSCRSYTQLKKVRATQYRIK